MRTIRSAGGQSTRVGTQVAVTTQAGQYRDVQSPLDTSIDTLLAETPLVARAFARYGIDFCCGSDRTLRSACLISGADCEVVEADVLRQMEQRCPDPETLRELRLSELLDLLLGRFHAPLRDELLRLERLSRRLNLVHRSEHDRSLSRVHELLHDLQGRFLPHLSHEEQVLFPALRSGAVADVAHLEDPEAEEREILQLLDHLEEMTDGFVVGPAGCNSRRALYSGLEALVLETRVHVQLEHDLLPALLRAS